MVVESYCQYVIYNAINSSLSLDGSDECLLEQIIVIILIFETKRKYSNFCFLYFLNLSQESVNDLMMMMIWRDKIRFQN